MKIAIADINPSNADRATVIDAALSSYETFYALIQARYDIRNGCRDLKSWIVRGRWFLDTTGIATIRWWKDVIHPGSLLDVVSYDEWERVFGRSFSFDLEHVHLPPPGTACPLCDGAWTMDNVHGAVCVREDSLTPRWEHETCASFRLEEASRTSFRAVLFAAGFPPGTPMRQIPNGYWRNADRPVPPWWRVSSNIGEFEIGWRKRVVSIEFSTDHPAWLDLQGLFHDQNVTKERALIHAWSAQTASEYLKRIREEFAARAAEAKS